MKNIADSVQENQASKRQKLEAERIRQNGGKPCNLTKPKSPHLQTSKRARPPRIQSSKEMEQEGMPKFKARPPIEKIFASKGSLGVYFNKKRCVTKPKEFHFATDGRIRPPLIPSKPESKKCNKAEPLKFNSVLRQEEEIQREMDYRQRTEQEDAQKKVVRTQPVLKDDPLPVPEKMRQPFTEILGRMLNVNHRTVDKA